MQLPDIDGFEVARWLKSDPALRETPLVAVTALAMVGDRDRVLAAGFDGYLAKPINPETFVRQMEAFLPRNTTSSPVDGRRRAVATVRPDTVIQSLWWTIFRSTSIWLGASSNLRLPDNHRGGNGEGLDLAQGIPATSFFRTCACRGGGLRLHPSDQSRFRTPAIPFVFITSTMLDEKDRAKGLASAPAGSFADPLSPSYSWPRSRLAGGEGEGLTWRPSS